QRLDQVPRRAVDACLVARVNVLLGPATPALPARDQLALDHALGAERDGHLTVGRLRRRGHEDPDGAAQRGLYLGPAHDLGEVGRPDLLLALGHEHEVERRLLARGADRVQRGDERRFGALLVHGPAAHDHLAEPGPVDQSGVPGRGRPLGGIGLLHVVHEVEPEGARGAGVERGDDAGLAVGRDLGHLVEAGVLEQAHGKVAALVHAAVLGGDGRLPDPLLQARHGFVVALFDLRQDRGAVVGATRRGGSGGAAWGGGAGGTIRGHVADSAGAALARVAVSVDAIGARTTTDVQGNYEIRGVPAGTYTVRVRLLGYVPQSVQVTVSDVQPTRHDFSMRV